MAEIPTIEFEIPAKVCEVCGTHVPIKKSGTCVQRPMIGETIYWDYMNCPHCGCQILLKRRYLDICKSLKYPELKGRKTNEQRTQ